MMSNAKERFKILLEGINGKLDLLIEAQKTLNTKMDNRFQEMEKKFNEKTAIMKKELFL